MDPVMLEEIKEMIAPLLPLEPGSIEYTTPGTYTFVVPAKCTKIYIEAISATSGSGGGGGGGGGGAGGVCSFSAYHFTGGAGYGGGGGGGISTIPIMVKAEMQVEPNQQIPIEIGAGGSAGNGGGLGSYGHATNHSISKTSYSSTSGNYGGNGGNGGASTATIFGDNIIVFPSSTANNAGSGGVGGGGFYKSACTVDDPYSGSYDVDCCVKQTSGGMVSPNTKVLCTETHNSTVLSNVQVITPTVTIRQKSSSAGKAGDDIDKYNRSYPYSGGAGGYGGAPTEFTLAAGDDSRLAPVLGGYGGTGGKGGDCLSADVGSTGNYGSAGGPGRKGKDGYIKISWGYD